MVSSSAGASRLRFEWTPTEKQRGNLASLERARLSTDGPRATKASFEAPSSWLVDLLLPLPGCTPSGSFAEGCALSEVLRAVRLAARPHSAPSMEESTVVATPAATAVAVGAPTAATARTATAVTATAARTAKATATIAVTDAEFLLRVVLQEEWELLQLANLGESFGEGWLVAETDQPADRATSFGSDPPILRPSYPPCGGSPTHLMSASLPLSTNPCCPTPVPGTRRRHSAAVSPH